jgi:D-amino-acid dehydrogenase
MSKHVVILGGGVIGMSVAEACSRRGHRVTVIDREPEKRDGCSFGNAGMVVPSHFIPLAAPGMVALGLKWMWNPESPFYIKPRLDLDLIRWGFRFMMSATKEHVERAAPLLRDLNFASRKAYLELSGEGEDIGLVTKGLLMLCKQAKTLEEEAHVAARARELGIPAEVLDAAATAALDPGIGMAVAGAVYFPEDCHLRPERYLAALQRRAESRGATFLWSTEVSGMRREGAALRAVKTSAGEIEGDAFVLCGGIWSDDLVKELGTRVPMQAGKGYSVTVSEPVERAELCSILTEARVAVTPMGGGMRFGGTMEISGTSSKISPRRVEGIIRAACEYFPAFERKHFDGIPPWHGLRPCSPDGLPYLGNSGAASNLTVATGHAMMGLSLAPVTGAIAARLVDDEDPGFDLGMLSPDRFA